MSNEEFFMDHLTPEYVGHIFLQNIGNHLGSAVQRRKQLYTVRNSTRQQQSVPPPTWTYTHPGVKPEGAGNTPTPGA